MIHDVRKITQRIGHKVCVNIIMCIKRRTLQSDLMAIAYEATQNRNYGSKIPIPVERTQSCDLGDLRIKTANTHLLELFPFVSHIAVESS